MLDPLSFLPHACALLIRASLAILFYYSRSLALQSRQCAAHRLSLSLLFVFSSCPPLLTYVSQTSCCLSDARIVGKSVSESFECGLFCCGVFHVAHLLHVEMRLRYLMWWWGGPMWLNLTSSSTNGYWRALPDRVLSWGLSVVPSWQMVLDRGGERSSVALFSLSESFTHGSLFPLGPLVGSASFVIF